MKLHRALLAAVVIALSIALYQVQGIIADLQSWDYLWQPPSVAKMIGIVSLFLGAVGAAVKLDLAEVKG